MKSISPYPVLAVALLVATLSSADSSRGQITQEQWLADAEFAAEQIHRVHPHIADPEVRARLSGALENFKNSGRQSREARIAGLMRLVASLRDDSSILYLFQEAIDFGLLPLLVYDFDDGLVVLDARAPHADLIGARVTHFEGRSTAEVFETLSAYLSAENRQGARYLFARYALTPELLHGAGLAAHPDRTELAFELSDGSPLTRVIERDTHDPWKLYDARNLRRVTAERESSHFWVEYRSADDAIVAEIRRLRDEPEGQTVSDFASRLGQILAEHPKARLVLDLRFGGGGSGHSMGPLLEALRHSPQGQTPGLIFALIGRRTGGTVLELASVLRNTTPILFVGESTGDGPNRVGDNIEITLPHSGIVLYLTEIEWPTTLREEVGKALLPTIPVPVRYVDYQTGQDAALAAALTTEPDTVRQEPVPEDAWQAWSGKYAIGEGQILRIFEAGPTGLKLSIDDPWQLIGRSFFQASSPLVPAGQDALSTYLGDVRVERRQDRLTLDWRGHRRPMRPVLLSIPEKVAIGGGISGLMTIALVIRWRRRAAGRASRRGAV